MLWRAFVRLLGAGACEAGAGAGACWNALGACWNALGAGAGACERELAGTRVRAFVRRESGSGKAGDATWTFLGFRPGRVF